MTWPSPLRHLRRDEVQFLRPGSRRGGIRHPRIDELRRPSVPSAYSTKTLLARPASIKTDTKTSERSCGPAWSDKAIFFSAGSVQLPPRQPGLSPSGDQTAVTRAEAEQARFLRITSAHLISSGGSVVGPAATVARSDELLGFMKRSPSRSGGNWSSTAHRDCMGRASTR